MPDFSKIAQMSAAGQLDPYATFLGKLAQFYGGGVDNTITLGKELVKAVAEIESSKEHLYPTCRVALLATNLTAPRSKAQDGFGRLVNRTDAMAVKAKKCFLSWSSLKTCCKSVGMLQRSTPMK